MSSHSYTQNPARHSSGYYRRNLPHWQPPGAILFLTFHLYGSLPKEVERRLAHERKQLQLMREDLEPAEYLRQQKLIFADMDQELAATCTGSHEHPRFLSQPDVAQAVTSRIYAGTKLRRFLLHRYCIMPNHVHLLIEPLPVTLPAGGILPEPAWPPAAFTETGCHLLSIKTRPEDILFQPVWNILKGLKGAASRDIKQLVALQSPVWQDESYDHWVRDEPEYHRIVSYMDLNPVHARLSQSPAAWPWSSLGHT